MSATEEIIRKRGFPFEDLEVWRAARSLVGEIYRTTSSGAYSRDFVLRDQTRGAVISVMSNIAEGYERDGSRELLQFLSVAKGSCGELRSHLYIAADQGYLSAQDLQHQTKQAARISRMISAFMKYLRESALRGRKFPSP